MKVVHSPLHARHDGGKELPIGKDGFMRRLAELKVPTVFVQEGGYAVEDIGTNVAGVLEGFLRA